MTARQIAEAIESDFCGRTKLELDELGEATREEILQTWTEIIGRGMYKSSLPPSIQDVPAIRMLEESPRF